MRNTQIEWHLGERSGRLRAVSPGPIGATDLLVKEKIRFQKEDRFFVVC